MTCVVAEKLIVFDNECVLGVQFRGPVLSRNFIKFFFCGHIFDCFCSGKDTAHLVHCVCFFVRFGEDNFDLLCVIKKRGIVRGR